MGDTSGWTSHLTYQDFNFHHLSNKRIKCPLFMSARASYDLVVFNMTFIDGERDPFFLVCPISEGPLDNTLCYVSASWVSCYHWFVWSRFLCFRMSQVSVHFRVSPCDKGGLPQHSHMLAAVGSVLLNYRCKSNCINHFSGRRWPLTDVHSVCLSWNNLVPGP